MFVSVLAFDMPTGSASDGAKTADIRAEAGEASSPRADLEPISTFEGGRLYRAGKFNVLVLNGTYREMGRQYGGLMGPQIKAMYEEALNVTSNTSLLLEEMGMRDPGVSLQNFTIPRFQAYPKRFQEMITGISQTSEVPLDEICTINEFFDYFLWMASNPAAQGHCSAITAWGNYTGGKPLVIGRNFDFPTDYKNFDKYITVVVFNPTDGSNSAAIVAYAGMVGAIQSFNEAGLVLENNDGSSSGDLSRPLDRGSFLIRDVQYMFDCSTLTGLDEAMKNSRSFYPLVYNVANQSEAYCYETTTFDVKRRGGVDGLLVGTNHFIIPAWEKEGVQINNFTESISRHQNLTSLGEKHKGSLNASVMMAIMDTPKERGGATHEGTIYQFVAVPELMKVWLKAPGFGDWAEVDLGTLFD